jgi:hypothetical protein
MAAERTLDAKGLETCLQSGRSILEDYEDQSLRNRVVEVMVQLQRPDINPGLELALGTHENRKEPRLVGADAAVVAML